MESQELVMTEPRARRVPDTMYVAGICVKGTENLKQPQFLVYSPQPALIKLLVASHNELMRLKAEKKG